MSIRRISPPALIATTFVLVLVLVLVLDRPPAPRAVEPPEASPRAGSAREGARALVHARSSLDEVALAALAALERKDAAALQDLRITKREYVELLFPEFPMARDPRNTVTPEFAWFLLDSKSRSGLNEALQDHGGQRLELLEVIVSEGIEEYDSFRLHKKVKLRVGSPEKDEEAVIRLFGSVVELDGQFKILSYPD
jgi:hypothetical protein